MQGSTEEVRAWLRERATDYIWIGDGNPMMEQFKLMHWCSDAEDPTQHGLTEYDNDDDFIRGRSPKELGCTETPGMSLMTGTSIDALILGMLRREYADESDKHTALTRQLDLQKPRSKRSPTVSLKKMRRTVKRP